MNIQTVSEQEFCQLLDTVYTHTEDTNQNLDLALQFITNHENFVKQNGRYMEFVGLLVLFHPNSHPRYYLLLDKLMGFATSSHDAQNLTKICSSLELLYAPVNVMIIKSAISTLLDYKAYQNAAKLCEYLEQTKQFRDKYHPRTNSAL